LMLLSLKVCPGSHSKRARPASGSEPTPRGLFTLHNLTDDDTTRTDANTRDI